MSCTSPVQKSEITLLTTPDRLGEGFLHVNLMCGRDLPLYRDVGDTLPIDTLRTRMVEGDTISFTTTALNGSLHPFRMYREDTPEEAEKSRMCGLIGTPPELIFRVLAHQDDNWTVVFDEKADTQEVSTAVFKHPADEVTSSLHESVSDPGRMWVFKPWEAFFTLRWGHELYALHDSIPICDKPDGKIILQTAGCSFSSFGVERLAGDWLEVTNYGRYDEDIPYKFSGWVRWHDGRQMLFTMSKVLE